MATKQITTDLFSFKTFRSPDKLDYNDRNKSFIHHPNMSQSRFNNCPAPPATAPSAPTESTNKKYADFIGGFKAANSYKEIRAMHTDMYDYSCLLMQQKRNDSTKKQLNAKLPAALKEDGVLKLWDELFAQIATQKSPSARQACVQLLVTQHYIQNNKTLELKDISKLVVVIPDVVIDCYKSWQPSTCERKLFGVHSLGVQDYRRVEQTLCCYVPGEVSHIENIMAREYKEKATRNLLSTEYGTETTSETEIENINDTTTTERNELNKQVAKELQKDRSFDLSGSVSVNKDAGVYGNITANITTGYNSSTSSSQSNTEAKNYAKEITARALERVVQKTTQKRTYKMIKEFEEKNSHGFDNRTGDNHITGVYRWVDKIYDNQMINYGRRLVFEISVPAPAKFYKMAMQWKNKKAAMEQAALVPPKTLAELGIVDFLSLTETKLNAANAHYNTAIQFFVREEQLIYTQFNNDTTHENERLVYLHEPINIPEGFVVDAIIDGRCSMHFRAEGASAYIELFINSTKVCASGDKDSGSPTTHTLGFTHDFVDDLKGTLQFEVAYKKVFDYHGAFKVKCVSDPALYKQWQSETYLALLQAYQLKLDQYNEEIKLQQAAQQAETDQASTENYSNPAMNRLIEERELKRICIEMMSKPYCYDMGKDFYTCKTHECKTNCGETTNQVPEVVQSQVLEKYTEFIKFFESFFHWEILSYVFYPYYYNAKCEWSELLQTKHSDPIFEAFLQSGMAKILVPVRPQFEKAVMWYFETGEIYTDGNIVPETHDDRYLSLLKELENQDEIRIEGTWKTRVPSDLTIIQAETAYLDETGLPCCNSEPAIFKSANNRLLEGLKAK